MYPSSGARLEFVQWSSSRRSFAKMLWRTSPKESRDNRRQQVTVFRAKMRAVIRFNTSENTDSSPDPEEKRQQHSCSSLLSISLTSEFAHTTLTVSVKLFLFGAKSYQEKRISRGLISIDRSTHAWGFDAESNIAECSDVAWPPPLFLFHDPLLPLTSRDFSRVSFP